MITVISFIVVLGILVFFHELGHYWVARRNGIIVEEFGMGYPPRLVKLFTYDGTDFTLNLIPFGGFARMKGEDASDLSPGSFNAASRGARAATLIAGPAMNALLAVILFAASFIAGFPAVVALPQLLDVVAGSDAAQLGLQSGDILLQIDDETAYVSGVPDFQYDVVQQPTEETAASASGILVSRDGQVIELTDASISDVNELLSGNNYLPVLTTEIAQISPGSPAEAAELQPGDQIYSVDGIVVTVETPLNELVRQRLGEEMSLTLLRDLTWVTVNIVPRVEPPAGQGALGIQISPITTLATLPPLRALWEGVLSTWEYVTLVLKLPIMLVMGTLAPGEAQLTGPVGIAQMVGGAVSATIDTGLWFPIWRLSAVLSAALAITNLLPLPALDGGRLLFILVETLRGRRVNPEREGFIHMIGFMLLLGLLALITVRDISTAQEGIDWLSILGVSSQQPFAVIREVTMDSESGQQAQPAYLTTTAGAETQPVRASSRVHTSAPRPCPNCGAPMRAGASICTECGEHVQFKPKEIRCRRCGGTASSALNICPHCGRDLYPAPSRLLTWGAPLLLVTLFLLVLMGRWDGRNPLVWAQETVSEGLSFVTDLSDQMEPGVTVVMTPVASAESENQTVVQESEVAADQVAEAAAVEPADASAETASPSAADDASSDGSQAGESEPTAEPPSVLATAQLEPTATEVPTTEQPTATPTSEPTATSTSAAQATTKPTTASQVVVLLPTATPTKPIAPKPNLAPAIASNSTQSSRQQATPTSTVTPSPTVSATAPPTETPVTYLVRTGDTILGIASRFDVSAEELMAANGIGGQAVYTLRVGESLVIPVAGTAAAAALTATATNTATALPTFTPVPATPTSTPVPTEPTGAQSQYRLDAPLLRSPENGATLRCSGSDPLAWVPVAYPREEDQYIVNLGYLSGYAADGSEQVTWIIQQPRKYAETMWTPMGDDLCGLAPQSLGREWRWYVEVAESIDGVRTPVSPPSEIWRFSWN